MTKLETISEVKNCLVPERPIARQINILNLVLQSYLIHLQYSLSY